jgi:hypothetical protein
MLKALWRWFWPQDPAKTLKSQLELELHYIPRAEFESEMQKLRDRVEWDLSEWYDKFSTLHARTAKRQQRSQQQTAGEQVEQVQPERPKSALQFRKPWSL